MSDEDRRLLSEMRHLVDAIGQRELDAARRLESEALDRQQRGLIAMWTLWMLWFTWFFGVQVAVLWNRLDNPALSRLIARSWLFNSAAGAVMAILVTLYTLRAGRRFPSIGFPTTFAAIGAAFNAVALLLNCILWYRL